MLTLSISKADLQTVRYERYSHPVVLVQKRLHTLYFKATTDLSHQMIGKIVGIQADTVTDYIRRYNTLGLSSIYEVKYGTNRSVLDNFKLVLLTHFEKHPPHTLKEAQHQIKELTGLERSVSQVRVWLKKQGFCYRKTGQIPSKADPERQRTFVEDTLSPLLQQADNEEIHLLFLDAAHFVMGVFQCCLWCIARIFIKSSSGRKRYNVLGAVDIVTKKIHTFTNTSYINAVSIGEFFKQLDESYKDDKPIYIVLDNARYQKCKFIKEIVSNLKIELVYLPPYSPNLNLIERLWKWVKKKALYAQFYPHFDDFKEAIDKTIEKANTTHKGDMDSLLTTKFQTF